MSLQFYIDKCKSRTNDHHTSSIHSRNWDSVISSSVIVIAGIQAMTMTVLTAVGASSIAVTVSGAVFAFVISSVSKIKDSYSFRALSVQHAYACDEFNTLYIEFIKIDIENINQETFDTLIKDYNTTVQKNHLQSVKMCQFSCLCCLNEIEDII